MTQHKSYYTIAEVSKLLDLPTSTLRWWEREIPELNPMRTKGGQRRYRPMDVETARKIKVLTQQKGWSLEAVDEFLRNSAAPKRRPTCRNGNDAMNLLANLGDILTNNPKGMAILKSLESFIKANLV